ncbi:MAG: hypothetical protein AAF926_08550 [Pseudomonadota bacterium]
MRALSIFPLMIVPVIIYNLMALSGQALSSIDAMRERLDTDFMTVAMASGVNWSITPGHALTALALVCLFFELIKSTGTGRAAVMNHAFSLILFIVCLVQFLLMPAFATSVFFIVGIMTLLDVLAGFMVTIASARRDFGVDAAFAD